MTGHTHTHTHTGKVKRRRGFHRATRKRSFRQPGIVLRCACFVRNTTGEGAQRPVRSSVAAAAAAAAAAAGMLCTTSCRVRCASRRYTCTRVCSSCCWGLSSVHVCLLRTERYPYAFSLGGCFCLCSSGILLLSSGSLFFGSTSRREPPFYLHRIPHQATHVCVEIRG